MKKNPEEEGFREWSKLSPKSFVFCLSVFSKEILFVLTRLSMAYT